MRIDLNGDVGEASSSRAAERDSALMSQISSANVACGFHAGNPGVMRATLRVRTHKAVVTIGFDESNFWIKYRDSKNLNYNPDYNIVRAGAWEDGPSIHSNYNTWVAELAKSIEVSTIAPGSSDSTNTAPCANAILVADELEKLAALRERGILTQEEFDKQKSKLLAQ